MTAIVTSIKSQQHELFSKWMTMPGHERTGIKLKFISTPVCQRATSFNLVILCLFSFYKDFLFFQNNVVELYPRLI